MNPVWDVTLAKVLRHEGTRFTLDVRFASAARRLVLFGPSGAGKTQTLRMIAGITHPDAGRVAVGGHTLFDAAAGIDVAPQRRRLALVFQDYALFPHLTVRQNIAFASRTGWFNPRREARQGAAGAAESADAADAAVERWIAAFHLAPVERLYPHQLSGGQRQRTALARSLVREPIALLLDEPFAALDRALRRRLRDELQDLQAQLALPMLLVTHDEDDASVLADEAVAMEAGRIVEAAGAAARRAYA